MKWKSGEAFQVSKMGGGEKMKRGRKKGVKRVRKNEEKRKGATKKEKGGRKKERKSGEGFQDAGKGCGKNFKLSWGIYTP